MIFSDWVLLLPYILSGLVLFTYGVNCYWHIGFFLRGRRMLREQDRRARILETKLWKDPGSLPLVTTQIPLFNEYNVAERVIEAVAGMDYPKERHQIQVLDDSTDETVALVDKIAAGLRDRGHWIEVLHRVDRSGFKAGALRRGLDSAEGEFVAIFDGDFVPRRDFLRKTLPLLVDDAGLGLVQGRWDHLNPADNLLCRAQVLGIDGHFSIEQAARASNRLFLNFNGTAGIWRKKAIFDAGNWEGDTLTEDMDLSYRAQLAGWRLTFAGEAAVPAELPSSFTSFKSQQFRWAKGSIQTARKLYPRVWRSGRPFIARLQAFFHLTHYVIHPAIVLVAILSLPVLFILPERVGLPVRIFAVLGIFVAALGPNTLYLFSQRFLHPRDWRRRILLLPVLTAVGLGISVSNARAVIEGIIGVRSGFVRTPKKGSRNAVHYRVKASWVTGIELFLAGYCALSFGLYCWMGAWGITPFLFLYAIGYGFVGIRSLLEIRETLPRSTPGTMVARPSDVSG